MDSDGGGIRNLVVHGRCGKGTVTPDGQRRRLGSILGLPRVEDPFGMILELIVMELDVGL
jgi:hypothetical protein